LGGGGLLGFAASPVIFFFLTFGTQPRNC
jgi:hypothetical protein